MKVLISFWKKSNKAWYGFFEIIHSYIQNSINTIGWSDKWEQLSEWQHLIIMIGSGFYNDNKIRLLKSIEVSSTFFYGICSCALRKDNQRWCIWSYLLSFHLRVHQRVYDIVHDNELFLTKQVMVLQCKTQDFSFRSGQSQVIT